MPRKPKELVWRDLVKMPLDKAWAKIREGYEKLKVAEKRLEKEKKRKVVRKKK